MSKEKDNIVFVDFGKIELDDDDNNVKEKFSYNKLVDNLDDSLSTIDIPEDMGKELINILKKEALKKRKKEKIRCATENTNSQIKELQNLINNNDQDLCDSYEEEDF